MDRVNTTLMEVMCDYLEEIKVVNPHVSWQDLMDTCIVAGGYMAKKSKINNDDYLMYLRSIQIVDEHIPSYFVGEA